jgi:hypothetical protein
MGRKSKKQHSALQRDVLGRPPCRPLLFPPSRIGAAGAFGTKINLINFKINLAPGSRPAALRGTSGSHLRRGREDLLLVSC